MTLQQPQQQRSFRTICCHKCGAEVTFSNARVGPSGRKIPLDPFFNNEPHQQHCMYFTAPSNSDLEPLLFGFLSMIPNRRQRRVIGAVGRARS